MLFCWRRRDSAIAAQSQVRTAEQSLRLRRIFDDTHDLAWCLLRRFGVPAQWVEDFYQPVFLITKERLDADDLLDKRRLIEVCDRILGRLKPPLREVFILHELEGLSGSEIARLLRIPECTVHSRLRRARLRVRGEVEALGAAAAATEVRGG